MSKPKMVTCRYCKSKVEKSRAFIEEYINDNLEIKNRYFCNEKCYNDKQNEIKRKERAKELKVKARELSRELCGLDQKEKSIYFSSTYKIITDKFDNELIYDYCTKYKNEILNLLNSKDFKTSASRIKYCLVMLENQLERYELELNEPKEEKVIEVNENLIDDFDINVNTNKKKRRDINDILGL
jgi:hypothetical protein